MQAPTSTAIESDMTHHSPLETLTDCSGPDGRVQSFHDHRYCRPNEQNVADEGENPGDAVPESLEPIPLGRCAELGCERFGFFIVFFVFRIGIFGWWRGGVPPPACVEEEG